MAGNSFGKIFRITTFGESHGPAIGVVIDGCPAGLAIEMEFIQKELGRRRPGQSAITTQRNESDEFELLSGVFEGKSTGAPITIMIRNKDQRSTDYERFKDTYRPSHADFTYEAKYGFRDYRGGGRSSARETAARVAAGAVAKLLLSNHDIKINAFVSQVGNIRIEKPYTELDLQQTETNEMRCPDVETAAKMKHYVEKLRDEGDSTGGMITCVIQDCPPGLGEPVFDKLHAELGKAMLSINAVKGFEIGSGFSAVSMKGSQHNDSFIRKGESTGTKTNHSGGIQGGISNGEDIYFNVAFKPVATIARPQASINRSGEVVEMEGKGRHDPCVVPRAVPIVEAMAALVLADYLLMEKVSRL